MSNSDLQIIKQINYRVFVTETGFDKFLEIINRGTIRADAYCPTQEECDQILVKELDKYAPFMLWVIETGYDTPENKENRTYLRRLLYSKMIIGIG